MLLEREAKSSFIFLFQLHRTKFVTVKEDLMLLAVGVIGASSFLLDPDSWNKVHTVELCLGPVVTTGCSQPCKSWDGIQIQQHLSTFAPHYTAVPLQDVTDVITR